MADEKYEGLAAEDTHKPVSKIKPRSVRIRQFFWERKKGIAMRFISTVGIGFDVYSIYKKYLRGDHGWAWAAIVIILINSIISTGYSIYIAALEKSGIPLEEKRKPKTGTGVLKMKRSESDQGFDDKVVHINLDSDSDSSNSLSESIVSQKKKKSKGVKVSFGNFPDTSETSKQHKKKQVKIGTYIQPGIVDPKMDDQDYIKEKTKPNARCQLSLSRFLIFMKSECSALMFVCHVLHAPKWYHFLNVSKILWKYLKESYDQKASSEIKSQGVKQVSYSHTWNEYVYREIMSKQLSLVMSVGQTIPMTFLELLYWSNDSIKNLNNDQKSVSFFSIQDEQFNIMELASVVLNILGTAYRVVSLMNQCRKIDFSRQDMGLFHLIYLTVIYFLLLLSRVICLYLVMCMENSYGLWMTCSILGVQFCTTFLVTRNLATETNMGTLIISNMLMMFMYMPPKQGRKITMTSYNLIISLETAVLFAFGWYYMPKSNADLSNPTFSVLGYEAATAIFFWCYLSFAAVFLLCWFLNSEVVSKKLFTYNEKKSRLEINRILSEVNEMYATNFQTIVGYHKQEESSFDAQQTIYLF